MANVQKTYALVLGLVLAVVGVWGLFTTSILGLFGVNVFQSVLHLIAAAFGIYAGTKGDGTTYNQVLGWIAIVLAVLGLVPGVKDVLLSLLNINMAITVLHLAIGVVTLGVFYGVKE
ncbi:MAG TPA: DUF4383 domain-containing protein [Candidatus Nanoarchaeia archaeon]|nr:DUF4383 domain-containing protein [Candidatus Nanoarchaeia archaeon]